MINTEYLSSSEARNINTIMVPIKVDIKKAVLTCRLAFSRLIDYF